MNEMGGFVCRTESAHYRLCDFAKTALINIFVSPYSTENLDAYLQDKGIPVDVVCCLQHLQLCFETEERARSLLHNISSLLKPGGYFLGITPDSSTIWSKYQKNIEASHNKGGNLKPIVPNCVRSENYMITFESEEEKFPLFGKKYQLKFTGDISCETHCLVHFPSLIRLAREAGLEYVEIQNLTEFYDDNRAQFAGLLCNGGNFVDPRGKLLARSFDLLGLYTTFIFQKPDLDLVPPISTPVLQDVSHMQMESSDHGVGLFFELRNPTQVHHSSRLPQYRDDAVSAYPPKEGGRQTSGWRHQSASEEEKNGHGEAVVVANSGVIDPPEPIAANKTTKGILGAGPADLRFAEPL
ncbi:unnamed protein product [Victoria cruziana]